MVQSRSGTELSRHKGVRRKITLIKVKIFFYIYTHYIILPLMKILIMPLIKIKHRYIHIEIKVQK